MRSGAPLDEHEQLSLALALSLAEQEANHAETPQNNDTTESDAALARRLQLEEDFASQHQHNVHGNTNAAIPSHANPTVPGIPVQPPYIAPPPPSTVPSIQHPGTNGAECAGCGKSLSHRPGAGGFRALAGFLVGPTRFINALGRVWHPECFTCAACGRPLDGQFAVDGQNQPYHASCYRENHHPRCHVCREYLPMKDGGRITWMETPFWRDKTCKCKDFSFVLFVHPKHTIPPLRAQHDITSIAANKMQPLLPHQHTRMLISMGAGPQHARDGTPRCGACTRLKPRHGDDWATLEDGRSLCLSCLGSVVPDTASAQPLYAEILAFYREQGMPLAGAAPPPLHLVDYGALNAATAGRRGPSSADPSSISSPSFDGDHGSHNGGHHAPGEEEAGPVFHTRGICITEYSQMVHTYAQPTFGLASLFGARGRGGQRGLDHDVLEARGPVQMDVTAILVLRGLPWLLTGCVIAHETMHAYLRLSGVRELAPRVEEGLCQLMALLWLEQRGGGRWADGRQPCTRNPEAYEERLAAFLGYQIRNDPSEVYGEGLRDALEAFQGRGGLVAVLDHVIARVDCRSERSFAWNVFQEGICLRVADMWLSELKVGIGFKR